MIFSGERLGILHVHPPGIMHVNLRDGADKREVGKRLLSRKYFWDQYIRTISNIPNFLAWVFWSDKISEIRRVLRVRPFARKNHPSASSSAATDGRR